MFWQASGQVRQTRQVEAKPTRNAYIRADSPPAIQPQPRPGPSALPECRHGPRLAVRRHRRHRAVQLLDAAGPEEGCLSPARIDRAGQHHEGHDAGGQNRLPVQGCSWFPCKVSPYRLAARRCTPYRLPLATSPN